MTRRNKLQEKTRLELLSFESQALRWWIWLSSACVSAYFGFKTSREEKKMLQEVTQVARCRKKTEKHQIATTFFCCRLNVNTYDDDDEKLEFDHILPSAFSNSLGDWIWQRS